MNASVYRKTRFEVRYVHQGPNSFGLVCSPRDAQPIGGKAPRTPELEIHESAFTDDEMRQVHAVLELLEDKFAAVYDTWANDPARNIELVSAAVQAKKDVEAATLETQRLELEAIAKRAELEQLDALLASKRGAA